MSKPVEVGVIRRPIQIHYTGGPAVVTLPSIAGVPTAPPPPLPLDLERTTNRSADVWADRDSPFRYTTAGAVYQARKELLIDMWNVVAGTSGRYNRATSLFELNGINDIEYEEATEIFSLTSRLPPVPFGASALRDIRTHLPMSLPSYGEDLSGLFFGCTSLKVSTINNSAFCKSISYMYQGCTNISNIIGEVGVPLTASNVFLDCIKLEEVVFKLRGSITLPNSPLLTSSCIATSIGKAYTNAGIVITLHPTAYARAIADPAVQSILAIKPNVTLAM